MKEAIDTLEFAIQDHPRLMTVLKSQRVRILFPAHTSLCQPDFVSCH